MSAPLASPASRAARLVATWVDLAPIVVPWFPLASILLAGQRDMGVFWLMVVLGAWSSSSATVVLLVGAAWLVRRRQTLGMAYVGLTAAGPRPRRLLLAAAAVWSMPGLLGALGACVVFALVGNDQDLQLAVLAGTWLLLYALNWLVWLGPSRRTLGDRLSGAQVVIQRLDASNAPEGLRGRSVWHDVFLLAPPILALPLVAQFRGGMAGGLLAILVSALPVAFKRWRK